MLHDASYDGNLIEVKRLIEEGADVNHEDDDGETPLNLACWKGHIDIARLLIDTGADVNQSVIYGYTPLLTTCLNGHTDIVQFLIESGADINIVDDDGDNPFHYASWKGHTEIMSMLIIEGVDTTALTSLGKTALDLAREEGKTSQYRTAFTPAALVAAKLRFTRSLLTETIMPAMSTVNTIEPDFDELPPPVRRSSRLRHTNTTRTPCVSLHGDIMWREDVAMIVFSFLDRHGVIEE